MRDADRAESTRYNYVVLGEEGRAVARVITRDAECPAIELDGAAVPMDVRAKPATIPLRPDARQRRGVEAVGVSRARLREGDSRRRCARGGIRPGASAARSRTRDASS